MSFLGCLERMLQKGIPIEIYLLFSGCSKFIWEVTLSLTRARHALVRWCRW